MAHKKRKKHQGLELPFFVNFGENTTSENRAEYYKLYYKEQIALLKNVKPNTQRKAKV